MSLIYHTPLSPEQQRAAGLPEPQPLAMADRVRFSELDILKHVNNAAYMGWFEKLRVRYSQERGISTYGGGSNPRIVVRSGEIHYRQEMVMDEDYIATCRCAAFRNTSYTLNQQIWSGGTLRASFDCVLVLLEPDGSGRRPLPDDLRARFMDLDGARNDADG